MYWYDASGERTVKASFDNEGVYINGALSGARTGTSKFTAYVSPYLVVSNGGNYTKHVYMGSQRITSKVSNSGIFGTSPVNTTELQAKYAQQTTKIKERFDSLGVAYSGLEQTGGLVSLSPPAGDIGGCYFYHPDHLGSSSMITDATGALVQHIQYVPFGEVFIEQRNASWSTPYKFNGKELDEETGLAYYHARYYDPRTSVWLSVDPLAEKMPNVSSYVYCFNNPVKFVDPDGRKGVKNIFAQIGSWMGQQGVSIEHIHSTLDVGGTVEPTPVCDILNTLMYLTEGQWRDAGLTIVGVVPYFGDAGKASKYALKVLDKSSEIGKIVLKGFLKNADGTYRADKYRQNLQVLTGKLAKGFDAHHTLPKADDLSDFFKNAGIDINDPKNLIWRESSDHRGAKSAEQLKLWRDFMKKNPDANADKILKQRDIIEKKVWGNTKGDNPIN